MHKIKLLVLLTVVMLAQGASGKKWSRECFHSNYSQIGGVCLLDSYGFVLEYANAVPSKASLIDNYDVMSYYLQFHNTLESVNQYSASQIREDKRAKEIYVGNAINRYCKTHGDIAGYEQIAAFHSYLRKHYTFANNVTLVKRMPLDSRYRSNPIKTAYADINSYLSRNTESSDIGYAALILYITKGGAHTVFLGYDGNYFIRDGNYTYPTQCASFDFCFSPSAQILEYMIFQISK